MPDHGHSPGEIAARLTKPTGYGPEATTRAVIASDRQVWIEMMPTGGDGRRSMTPMPSRAASATCGAFSAVGLVPFCHSSWAWRIRSDRWWRPCR